MTGEVEGVILFLRKSLPPLGYASHITTHYSHPYNRQILPCDQLVTNSYAQISKYPLLLEKFKFKFHQHKTSVPLFYVIRKFIYLPACVHSRF